MFRMFRILRTFIFLILIFERNKIFFIIEFIYYKFSVIIIIFFFYWFFKTWLFLSILFFLLDQSRFVDCLSFNFEIMNKLQQFNKYKRRLFVISLICLIRAFSVLRAIISFACYDFATSYFVFHSFHANHV
jgi:hypothetical protein